MVNLYSMYETDKNKETNGVWYTHDSGARFLIARAGGTNVKYLKAAEKVTRPYRGKFERMKTGIVDMDMVDEVRDTMVKLYASTIVLDWEGITDRDGNEMGCTFENVVKLFSDLPEVFDDIQTAAFSVENFLLAEMEDDLGN